MTDYHFSRIIFHFICVGNQRTCDTCKHNVYPNSRPVGIVLVTDASNSRALLLRQHQHPPGMFTCIAGFADVGESFTSISKATVNESVYDRVSPTASLCVYDSVSLSKLRHSPISLVTCSILRLLPPH